MNREWTINPVTEVFSEYYGLDPTATDQWALAMGDYINYEFLKTLSNQNTGKQELNTWNFSNG